MRIVVALTLLLSCGCGAYDEQVPAAPVESRCPAIDEKLTSLLELVEQGQLEGLQSAIKEDISPDVRNRIIEVLLSILKALPENSLKDLIPVSDSGQLSGLLGVLRDVFSAVVEAGDAGYSAMEVGGGVLQQCTGKPLLQTLDGLLMEPSFRAALRNVLESGLDVGIELPSIDFTTVEGRSGFQGLVRTLIAGLSEPGFKLPELTSLLGPDLLALLEPMVASEESLASLQLVTRCLLIVDTEDELAGLIFDVLQAGVLDEDLVNRLTEGQDPAQVDDLLDNVLQPMLHLLVTEDSVRASLVIVATAVLRADVAGKVIPDLVVLMDAGVLQDLLDLMTTLMGEEC